MDAGFVNLKQRWFEVGGRTGALKNIGNIETKTLNGNIPYKRVFNESRKKRPNQVLAENPLKECNLCKEAKRWEYSGDNAISERYLPYLIYPNLYPIEIGHAVIAHREHADPNRLGKEDLEMALRIVKETDYRVWHNMAEAALSIPHQHFQAVLNFLPIEFIRRKPLSNCDGIYELEGYPGSHIVFSGDSAPEMAELLVRRLKRYTATITNGGIHIFPIRVPQGKGGIGGFETGGAFVTDSREEYEKTDAGMLEQRLRDAMYRKEELDLFKVWVEASSSSQR